MMSQVRCEMNPTPVCEDLMDLEKVVVIGWNNDHLRAIRLYVNSLIRAAANVPVQFEKDDMPSVLVFDGKYFHNEREFAKVFVNDKNVLKRIRTFHLACDTHMLVHLKRYYKTHLACNINLQLIVIIPNSPILYPDLLDKINKIILSFPQPVKILLIIDGLSDEQLEFYKAKPICEVLFCRLTNSNNPEEKPVPKKPKVSILSSRGTTQIKDIELL